MDTLLKEFKLNKDKMNCLKGGLPDVADDLPIASDPLPIKVTFQTVEILPGPQDAYSDHEVYESHNPQPQVITDHIHLFGTDEAI